MIRTTSAEEKLHWQFIKVTFLWHVSHEGSPHFFDLICFGCHKLYQGGRQSHAKIACDLRQSHANCTRVAAIRMQIPIDFIYGACNWRPRWYNSYETGKHSDTICMQLADSRMYFLHAIAASTVQSHQFFDNKLPIIWIKNEDATKKSERLYYTFLAHNVWPNPILWDSSFKSSSKAWQNQWFYKIEQNFYHFSAKGLGGKL